LSPETTTASLDLFHVPKLLNELIFNLLLCFQIDFSHFDLKKGMDGSVIRYSDF